ncbi:uncharacterized protein DSM5745_01073 [Aspergillus mulundensis]|uniref:RED-like N-terminal domain-containing protein n=1 Tax=Aspergillus mulundensis TaxID=1810919 RepID=A0A3D8T5N7_9EURO|nr:Uncharacterized protein DSM5745_01073 [Aspergillus mulundensis]RDW93751.1 Uncharacterized protein DSM5745_01073 [Aspergillus mulundensis]
MNNEQFRRLLFDNNKSTKPQSASPTGPSPTGKHGASSSPQGAESHGNQTPTAAQAMLGSRMRSSIPMTPRTLTAPNFASQLADYRRERDGHPPPTKKFKASAAPKGTKLPAGYEDRAAARLREDEGGKDAESVAKLRELEERFKKGVIDEGTFVRLRRELGVGGDLGSTHMVKGLDWDLLRKVRAGEDVERTDEVEKEGEEREDDAEVEADGGAGEEEVDVDEEFDKVLEGEEGGVLPSAPKEKGKKKGIMAPAPAPAVNQRKTRDEILRELRASRAAASASAPAPAPAPESALGARFKRIGDSKPEKKRFIEQDENGRRREVLLITDSDGKTKRKTRWLDKPGTTAPVTAPATTGTSAPEKEKDAKPKPLGMEVPADIAARIKAAQKNVEDDEDDDIFAGVGADYDPLGGAGSDEDSSDSEGEEEGEVAPKTKPQQEAKTETAGEPTTTAATVKPRNYFATSTTGKEHEQVESDRDRTNPLTKDPTILAALKRAAALRQAGERSDQIADDEEGVDKETLLRRKKFLEEAKRREALDAMDLDYGFGGSRIEDDEDEDAVVLETESRGGNKRKRGPKKRKGDKDSAADVLGVLEGRKK